MNVITTQFRRPSNFGFSVRLMVGCVIGLLASLAWSRSLEVIELEHRTAAEVIPVLQPLVEPGGALSGQDYKLFARVSKANLVQLRQALATLDRKPRQLLISVRNSSRQELDFERAEISGELSTTRQSITVQGTQSTRDGEQGGIATVRVLEGGTASIATGQSIPVVTSAVMRGGRHPMVAGSVDYRDMTSGFLVTPRLSGEAVTLQIEQQSQQLDSGAGGARGNVTTHSLATQVSGRVGEWIALSGTDESATSTIGGVLSRRYETQSSNRIVWIKVQALD